jgi:hypothetical protein
MSNCVPPLLVGLIAAGTPVVDVGDAVRVLHAPKMIAPMVSPNGRMAERRLAG